MTDTKLTGAGKPRASMLQVAIALGAVYLIWGSTYLAMRFAIETIPPFLMAGARYFTAGTLLYAWSRSRGAPRPSLVHWRSAVLVGALLLLVGNGGVVWAEQRVSSGLVALLVSTEPLWIVLMVWLRDRRQKPGGRVVAGLLLGFTGLVLLVRPSHAGGLDPWGVAAVMIASLCWAFGSLYGQRAKLPDSPQLTTAMQMLCGGSLLLLAGLGTGETSHFALAQVSTRSLLALAYLIVFGAIIAFTAYVWLLRTAPPVLVSTYAYVNPVIAVFLGWALAGEPFTKGTLVAAAVILVGVALISSAQGEKTKTDEPSERERPVREPELVVAAIEEEEEAAVCASR